MNAQLVEWLWNGQLRSRVCFSQAELDFLLVCLSLNPNVDCVVIWEFIGCA